MRFYIYDKKSVSYKRFYLLRPKKIIYFIISQLSIIIISIFLLSQYSLTPKERRMENEIDYLLTEFDDINKRIIQSEAILRQVEEHDSIIYQTIFESEGFGSSVFNIYYESLINNDFAPIVQDMNRRLSILDEAIARHMYHLDRLLVKALDHQEMLASLPAIQPIENEDLKRTASGWGIRMHPVFNIRRFHYGLDFTAPIGTPIYATGDAKVQYLIPKTSRDSQGYGNLIILDHGWGYQTLYAHLDYWEVKVGQEVKRGQIIGRVGNTGISTGPHLHYEVIKDGRKVNPINYLFNSLTPHEYRKIIEISNSIRRSYD